MYRLRERLALRKYGADDSRPKEEMTFGTYAALWMESYVNPVLAKSTARGYASILEKHLLPKFGRRPLKSIDRMEVKGFLAGRRETGLSLERVKRINAVLMGIFTHAMDDELVDRNPAERMARHLKEKGEGPKKEVEPYTAEELATYLETAREIEPRYFPFFLTLARTGLRLGEALGLEWGDVDFAGRFIHVRNNLVDGHQTTPKSGRSRRVKMSSELCQALTRLKLEREAEAAREGWKPFPPWVFLNEKGRPMDGRNLRSRVHRRIYERAGLRRINLHDFRHTYATLRLSLGHSRDDVAEELGHSSTAFTSKFYHHWMPDHHRSEVEELDRIGKPTAGKGTETGEN